MKSYISNMNFERVRISRALSIVNIQASRVSRFRLDLGNGSSLPDPSTLKDWLRESDAITSWPPIFLTELN